MTHPRWKRRPHGSTWGDFGPDDERGRLNLLTPEKVREGVAEAREGLTFCLSLPLEYPGGNVLNPRRHPPVIRPTVRGARPNFNFRLCEEVPDATDVICDDLVVMHLQYSTQWDSLAHVGQLFDADGDGRPEAVYYNGFRAEEDVVGPAEGKDAGVPSGPSRTSSQARRLGVHRMAEHCLQGRGVMIDLHAHLGREPVAVGYERLMRVLEADKVEVETGDMVCLHTGFAALLLGRAARPIRRSSATPAPPSMGATKSSSSGSPTRNSPASSPTTTQSRPTRPAPAKAAARNSRSTNIACSSSA